MTYWIEISEPPPEEVIILEETHLTEDEVLQIVKDNLPNGCGIVIGLD